MQLKYRKLVPSLHSEILNPNIDFPATPFKVQQVVSDWESGTLRRAGISSFGAGGAGGARQRGLQLSIEEIRKELDAYLKPYLKA